MKNLENMGLDPIRPSEEVSEKLARQNVINLELDSITTDEELERLKRIYSNEDAKQRLLKDLKSTEFAIASEKNNLDSRVFKELYNSYSKLTRIYELVYEKPYSVQINSETGLEDYAEELENKS